MDMLVSSAIDRGFKSWLYQTKEDYKIGISCLSTKHTAIRNNSKDWLAQNQDVSEWSNMSIHRLLFQ